MSDSGPTVREALASGARHLTEAGIPDAVGDSRRLLAHALGISLGRLTVRLDDAVEAAAVGVSHSRTLVTKKTSMLKNL